MSYVVECLDITKNYGKTKALSNVSMNIEKDKIYGLLGRNGAGKSTLINIISSQSFQNSGEVKILGETPFENTNALEKLCIVKEKGMFITDMKVKDSLEIASMFYPNWDKNLANRLLDDFELNPKKIYKQLSLGMKSQLGIIVGLSSRAPITIFDEPYIGLDAAGRQFFYDALIEDYMENPRTIVLSTHLIDEVSKLLEEIIILHKGTVIMEGNADDIRNKAFHISGDKEILEKYMGNIKVLHKETLGKTSAVIAFDIIEDKDIKSFEAAGLDINPVPLQQLFIYLTGGKIVKRGDINEKC